MSNILFVVTSLLLGWVALWPARRSFDAVMLHALAIPLGLLTWIAPALAFAALGRPWALAGMLPLAFAAAFLMAGGFALAVRGAGGSPGDDTTGGGTSDTAGGVTYGTTGGVTRKRGPAPAPALWTYPLAAVVAAGVAWWQVFEGFSLVGFDSYGHWEASGMWLSEVGTIEPSLMSGRALLVPSWQAAARVLGSQWGGAVYPVLAVVLLVLLARLLWVGPVTRLPVPARVAVALGVPALLAASFPFRYHAFLVHTHMAAAVYLLGSVGCLVLASRGAEDGAQRALLLASGLLAAAFALTRPDTPAYLILPIGLFAAEWLTSRVRSGGLGFWLGMLVPLWAVYGFAFATLGLWVSPMKLGGKVALALMLALTAAPAVLWGVRGIARSRRLLKEPADVMRLIASAEAIVLLPVLYFVRQNFATAAGTMISNLFWAGMQGFAWYFAVGLLLTALLFPAVRRAVPFGREVLFALFQFFVAAIAVHATSHVGRVALNDSFNRVSFHALPLVFWYFGLLVVTSLDVLIGRGAIRSVGSEPQDAADGTAEAGAGA